MIARVAKLIKNELVSLTSVSSFMPLKQCNLSIKKSHFIVSVAIIVASFYT